MERRDKVFVVFIACWLLVQVVGLAVLGHRWQGNLVNLAAMVVLALLAAGVLR